MASVFKKHGKWYIKVKQVDGRWVPQPTAASTKSEAKGLALELERKSSDSASAWRRFRATAL